MNSLTYKLDTFEGPLDLLLSLISKNKIDIEDIPIAFLCDQYMEYISAASELDIELSSDFIVMASELMLIKSRMLLPKNDDENEEDPRAALAAAVLEYKRAKEAAEFLGNRFGEFGLRMIKDTDEISVDKSYVADHSIDLLTKAYNRVLNTVRVSDSEAVKRFDPLIESRPVTMRSVVSRLAATLEHGNGRVSAVTYFSMSESRSELIASFMAMLELLKSGLIFLNGEEYSETGVIDFADDVMLELREGTLTDELFGALADE